MEDYEFYRLNEFSKYFSQVRSNEELDEIADELEFEPTKYGYVREVQEQTLEQQINEMELDNGSISL